MIDIISPSKTALKIFIASSAEVKDERDECVQICNRLENAHQHLFIKPVLWEFNIPHSNYPGHTNIQDAINQSELKDCPVVLFIFFSKIGKYTIEEFNYAIANNKRVFVYFKQGFSPIIDTIETYNELLKFQQSLNDTLLYEKYKDLTDFRGQLYTNLNLYLSQTYLPLTANAVTQEDILAKLYESEKSRKDLELQLANHTQNDDLKTLAQQEIKKGDYEAAKEHLKQSAEKSIEDTSSTFFELGKISNLQLLYQDAFNYFELAAKIAPQNYTYLYNAGLMANTLGLYDISLDYYYKSLAACNNLIGEKDDDIATSYTCIGINYCCKDEYSKAIEYYQKALTICIKNHGEINSDTGTIYNNLIAAYLGKGDNDKAIEYIEKTLVIIDKNLSVSDDTIGIWYGNFGQVYDEIKDFNKAIQYYEKALIFLYKIYSNGHPHIATTFNDIALTYANMQEYKKAINYYQKALVMYKKFFYPTHPFIKTTEVNLRTAISKNKKS